MDVYGGYGLWEQFGAWRFLTELNFGTGGGGRAPAGGGLLYGAGGEVQYHHNQYFIGGSTGVIKSLDGPFYFSFIGLHLGTDFNFTSTQNEIGYLPMDLSIEKRGQNVSRRRRLLKPRHSFPTVQKRYGPAAGGELLGLYRR
jgi:hypothetical protein